MLFLKNITFHKLFHQEHIFMLATIFDLLISLIYIMKQSFKTPNWDILDIKTSNFKDNCFK